MSGKKMGLGRGLNTLIPKAPIVDEEVEQVKKKVSKSPKSKKKSEPEKELTLPIDKIEPNPDQPRNQFDEDTLQELSDSIKQYGMLQPILVTPKDGFYEIIAGERRWRAAKLAGLNEVPVMIRKYSENEVVEIALIENIQRDNLNPIEEAMAYKRLMEEFQLKQDEVAGKVSKSRAGITNSLRLLKLDPRVQKMLEEEMISTGHARALLAITNKDQQYEIAQKVFDEKLSVRDIEKLVKDLKKIKKDKKEEKDVHDILYTQLEESMKQVLGSKVSIKNKKNNKGKIEIEYYSRDELERIVDMIRSI
ncbi:Probable chromosome-partitioning protein parB [uncultured Eubacterium sp.]|nr:Probable chromosome-partitioning protein parB [uncultured Eubacterium sp.]